MSETTEAEALRGVVASAQDTISDQWAAIACLEAELRVERMLREIAERRAFVAESKS